MRASPIITSLNAGEFSPAMEGRVDFSKYPNGCKVCENFIILRQGPALRRGGSRYVAKSKTVADRSWLVKFEFSATVCYYLEFGDHYVRFYTNHGQLLSAGVPYEVASPYDVAGLTNADGSCALTAEQSGDVLYLTHQARTYPPQKLTRFAITNWAFSVYQPNQGPFLELNRTATTVYASAQTGAVNLIASAALFAASDVGRLFRLEVQNQAVRPWETNKNYAANDLVRFDGKTYKALPGDTTSGTSPPIHEHGTATDGQSGVLWQYMDSGYGLVRLTAVADTTHATGNVVVDELNGLAQIPAAAVGAGNASKRWSLGAWSDTTEYPATVCFWKGRLWWGGKQRLWGSVPNDFENMAGDFFGVTGADNAIWWQLQARDVNDILWLYGADKLLIGTGGGEFAGGAISANAPVGPANFEIVPQSRRRVRAVAPAGVSTAIIYVQRAGRKLLSMNYEIQFDRFTSADVTVLADRITRSGITSMAHQVEPNSTVWVALANGQLRAFAYDPEQQVTGWGRVPLGGENVFVECVLSGPAPDGTRDEVWVQVRRTIDGKTVRTIEFLEKPWEGPDEDGTSGDDPKEAYYVDCGLTYRGAPASVISGFDHLEGQTLQLLVDGATHPDRVVVGGTITLDRQGSVVHGGLANMARIVPNRLEAGARDGTAQGKTKRIDGLVIRFLDTLGGKVGPYQGTLDPISLRAPATPMGEPPPISSGDVVVDYGGDYDRDALIEIRQDQPLPMAITAIMPRLKTADP